MQSTSFILKKRVNTLERKLFNQLPATKTIQLENYKTKQSLQHKACSFLFLQQVSAKSKCRGYPRYIGKSQFTLEHRRVSARTASCGQKSPVSISFCKLTAESLPNKLLIKIFQNPFDGTGKFCRQHFELLQ